MTVAAVCMLSSPTAFGDARFEGECGGRWLTKRFKVSRGAFPDQRQFMKLHGRDGNGLDQWEQRFQVFGWSGDGMRWAYCEEGDYGQSATILDRVILRLLTVKGSRTIHMTIDEEMTDTQQASALRRFRPRVLKALTGHKFGGRFGDEVFKTSRFFTKVEVDATANLAPGLRKRPRISFKVGDQSYVAEARLQGKEHIDDVFFPQLTVRVRRSDQKRWKTVLKDRSRSTTLKDCSIVYASLSPDSRRLALLIAEYAYGFEGHRTFYYIGAVTTLP